MELGKKVKKAGTKIDGFYGWESPGLRKRIEEARAAAAPKTAKGQTGTTNIFAEDYHMRQRDLQGQRDQGLIKKLEEATFWHEKVCLGCGAKGEWLGDVLKGCGCAREHSIVDANDLAEWLERIDRARGLLTIPIAKAPEFLAENA